MRPFVGLESRLVLRAAFFFVCSIAGVEGGGEDGDEDEDVDLYLWKINYCIYVADSLEMLDTTVTSLLLRSVVGLYCSRAKQHRSMD